MITKIQIGIKIQISSSTFFIENCELKDYYPKLLNLTHTPNSYQPTKEYGF